MVDTKSKDDKSKESGPKVAAKSSDDTKGIYETTEENSSRLMDEIIKIQAEYSQALSNLQSDYIKTIKNIVSASFLAQKHLADNVRWWKSVGREAGWPKSLIRAH